MKINLANCINTDYYGFQQLIDIYHGCKAVKDITVTLDFTELEFIDGNMCALFAAIVYKLSNENNLQFVAIGDNILGRFDVLFRNGFLVSNDKTEDVKKTTVPLRRFLPSQKDEFCEYLKNSLMQHRGMKNMPSKVLKAQITDDLIEILSNIQYHSNTDDPFFICGQYYPQKSMLVVTIVDIGVGFLPAITLKTSGKITSPLEAIEWALAGNSTKTECLGGIGLKSILNYCENNQGILHVVSGDAYYATDLRSTMWNGKRKMTKEFVGTTINLYFKV